MSALLNGKFFHSSPKKWFVECSTRHHLIPKSGFSCVTVTPDPTQSSDEGRVQGAVVAGHFQAKMLCCDDAWPLRFPLCSYKATLA